MTATSYLRGHPIHYDGNRWRFTDTDEPTVGSWQGRPCGHCGRHDTPEGHDACLGTLPGVINACCGHGRVSEAYIQYLNGRDVRGVDAINEMARMRVDGTGEVDVSG